MPGAYTTWSSAPHHPIPPDGLRREQDSITRGDYLTNAALSESRSFDGSRKTYRLKPQWRTSRSDELRFEKETFKRWPFEQQGARATYCLQFEEVPKQKQYWKNFQWSPQKQFNTHYTPDQYTRCRYTYNPGMRVVDDKTFPTIPPVNYYGRSDVINHVTPTMPNRNNTGRNIEIGNLDHGPGVNTHVPYPAYDIHKPVKTLRFAEYA
ncbi:unnamed protein product [Owenia fusiformis]|uniref:Uncharacterized protein n=1 Tax=Owenia fusiformis TaxID=6347 RepID=A0A8J1U3N6_OWEFU|nr:unnamed protein product [Owenia fusiformis]